MVPSATRIHESLTIIANGAAPLAIVWHVLFAIAGFALFAGWRPSRRIAAALLVGAAALIVRASWPVRVTP